MNAITEEIETAVKETVSEQFADDQISFVNIESAEDSDGDPILRIHVVFEGKDTLNGGKMAGLTRHLIARLSSTNAVGFPLVTFVSKNDAPKLNLAIA